eukprot:CAMPEP_0185263678 /NCGR_PEP_ID=MMETSP1359-20130426/15643_1 /TAXON_ID=552665 /ORGANISM="Bigelowiella longifila, Strain CCMP242" /LENGTH=321 /DNA_ID=CAMNT_0027851363 /DNA_START=34 /DNA_END=999 /DNA_ORIENTATION=+
MSFAKIAKSFTRNYIKPLRSKFFQTRTVAQMPKMVHNDVATVTVGAVASLAAVAGGMYYFTQPNYAAIRAEIEELLDDLDYDDGSYGPVFVRLAWHNAGTYNMFDKTGGSEGAGMRFATEAKDPANAGLDIARARLEPIKQKYPEISYSDLWSLAGTVAIESLGGPKMKWVGGRKDNVSEELGPPAGRLPDAARGADHLRAVFYRMGFSDQEIVALSGAHVLGRCHTDRSGFKGPWVFSPTTFSNEYYRELFENKWKPKKWNGPHQFEDKSGKLMMLPTDMAIIEDPAFKPYAETYYKDEELFFKDFAKVWYKLQHVGFTL